MSNANPVFFCAQVFIPIKRPSKVKIIDNSTRRHAEIINAPTSPCPGLLEGGLSFRQLARRMGCSPLTIINLRRHYQETDSVNDRPRPG